MTPTALRRAASSALLILAACGGGTLVEVQPEEPAPEEPAPEEPTWIPLFNGRDLDDWVIKMRGQELGVDPWNTYRVEDGVLRVVYDEYDAFDGRFGHIFYRTPFERYRIRVEYRFHGEQTPGGPGWAFRNSGVMLHCQAPESMTLDQEFPVSIEGQLLGGDGERTRSTANLCTPGTNVVRNGELERRHCINSTSETYHGDDWVVAEFEVLGGEVIRHWMDGEVVLEYTEPQLDERDGDAQLLLANGASKILTGGHIALQAESHPMEYRRVEVLPLD